MLVAAVAVVVVAAAGECVGGCSEFRIVSWFSSRSVPRHFRCLFCYVILGQVYMNINGYQVY